MKEYILATGAVLSGMAASTCCVIPLAFVSAGIGGAWIGSLTALAPYQPLFVVFAVACLGAGFWLVHRRPSECADGACGTTGASRAIKNILLVKVGLWIGTMLVALSLGVDYGGRLFL